MASSRFLAIFFAILLSFATTTQAYDHHIHDDIHVRGNYFRDHFVARAFGFKRSLKLDDSTTNNSGPKIVRVDDFGAKGNATDGTDAFMRAWDEACSSTGSVEFVVPRNTYLLKPITFKGPCKSDEIRVQILGILRASTDMSEYEINGDWIVFNGVRNLTVEASGSGTVNGWGGVWWNRPCKVNNTQPCPRAPTGVTFNKCENLVVRNLRSLNAQGAHFSINECNNVNVSGLTVTAPADSPNTVGINVTQTTNLHISDCNIATGDDCIAINDASHDVRVSRITCGPGHGISIGGLGGVSDVVVDGAKLSGTTNGVRIKTLKGESGSATGLKFMNIEMENVQNPILIDQNSAVQVRDVLYKNITGTSASQVAVDFECSDKCRGIFLQDVDLRCNHGHDNARASCTNIELTEIGAVTPLCPNNDDVTRSNSANSTPPPSTPRPAPARRAAPVEQPSVRRHIINVDDFGAKGNGRDDDTDAFNRAWQQVCSSNEKTLLVVPQKSYLVKPVRFGGPCKSNVTVQILGTIEASEERSDYPDRHWLWFDRVNDLVVEGGGTIDGNGDVWWRNTCKKNKSRPCTEAPTSLTFQGCQHLEVRDLTIKNAPQMQVIFTNCVDVRAHNLTVSAPGDSPNTDGIHITHSQNIDISNSVIATGDDCISIVSGSRYISASDIRCGPGHGISIGSLGGGNSEAHVSDVTVTRARFFGSTNGVRIKTWQGGSGNVSNIKFVDMAMHNVQNPIIIDQNYCIEQACKQQESAVKIKDVLYQNIKGTVNRDVAIKLDCSESHKCEGIVLQDIDLRTRQRGDHAEAVCNNVDFTALGDVSPHCPNN